jgi:hypothetical protein
MSDSFFRDIFEHLRALPGRRIEWPQLLRFLIENELTRIREQGQPYVGEVFRDRDQHAYKHEFHKGQHLEVVSAQRLYREVHRLGKPRQALAFRQVARSGGQKGCRRLRISRGGMWWLDCLTLVANPTAACGPKRFR